MQGNFIVISEITKIQVIIKMLSRTNGQGSNNNKHRTTMILLISLDCNSLIIVSVGSDIINNSNNRRNNSNSHSRVANNFDNVFIRFNNNQPTIVNHDFGEDVFDPIFMIFGSTFNNAFRNNFSSNFRSNFVNNDFASVIEESMRQSQNQRKPPASKDAVSKLKKFKMTEKYCKKNDKGVLEHPSCCVCISDISKGEETLLLPCGHMFHSSCIADWLSQNNTCPVCRFELPVN
jgi:hypothetical protein